MLTATERIFRELHEPSPSKPAAKPTPATAPIALDWTEVQAILARKRDATAEELNYIISNAKQFFLSSWQRNDIAVRLTLALANRGRAKPDPNLEFIHNTLHVIDTPAGSLQDFEWVQREMQAGSLAIASCKRHRPPRCQCWREARERLWRIQDRFGSNSPESWATERLWVIFEEMENASRPERTAVPNVLPQPIPQDLED